jgi:hypothetical protein
VPYGGELFFAAYRDLVSCRPPDGPIPWTAAMEWADRHHLRANLADALWAVVSQLDGAEREWRFEQIKAEREASRRDA